MISQVNTSIGEETKHEKLYIDGVGLSELPQSLLIEAYHHFERVLKEQPYNWRDAVVLEHLKTELKSRPLIS